jgi:hypothetical protein
MGYAVVDQLGNITALSRSPLSGSISYNDDVVFDAILQSPKDWKWLNEVFVYIPQPTPYHRWTGVTWIVEEHLKDDAKDDMWQRIKAYRDMRECSGVQINIDGVDYWFHSDTRSLIKYLFLLFLATIFSAAYTSPITWKTMTDAEVPLTAASIRNIFFKVLATGNILYGIGRQHKQNMLASPDPLSYNYKTGSPPWPPVYEE